MTLSSVIEQFELIDKKLSDKISLETNIEGMNDIMDNEYLPLFYDTFDFLLDKGYVCYYGEILNLNDLSLKNIVLYVGKMFKNDETQKTKNLKKVIKKHQQFQ